MARTANPEKQKKTRKALFQIAARAFLRDGYEATGMKALAEEAGCTTGKFYFHYSGKEEILTELLAELFRGNKEAAERTAGRKKDCFYGAMFFLSMLYQGAKAYPNLRDIYHEGISQPAGRELCEEILTEMLDDAEAIRIRVAISAIPVFFREEGGAEEQYLTMLAQILGKNPEEAEAYEKRISEDSAKVREKAYDVLVRLLQGPGRKNVKKL